jgi:hypothetical protein
MSPRHTIEYKVGEVLIHSDKNAHIDWSKQDYVLRK